MRILCSVLLVTMPACAVFGCNNYSRKTKGTLIKYYSFPKNEDLRKRWIQACRRLDKFIVEQGKHKRCFVKKTYKLVRTQKNINLKSFCFYWFKNKRSFRLITNNLPTISKNVKNQVTYNHNSWFFTNLYLKYCSNMLII